jgi:drug/metabolite transporter (DMT)-like permease
LTAFCWGVLPIALTIVHQRMDSYTITWYRVIVASCVLGAILGARGGLPRFGQITHSNWRLLVVALLGLAGNWVLYVAALAYTTPSVTQTVVQLSPLFLLLGGLAIYKEPFTRWQWLGLCLLVGGLVLFFNQRLPELLHITGGLGLGVGMLLASSLLWTAYALVQKGLLKHLSSPQILWLLYVGSALLLLPLARLGDLRGLDGVRTWLLVFCCANTLVGYGAFAEALQHWEVSRVSAVIALAPIFTVVGMHVAAPLAPGMLQPEGLTRLSLAGALLVVVGSMLSAFGLRSGRNA